MSFGFTIRIRGQVQGVGFRPFVYQLALDFGAAGTVQNDAEGVLIYIYCKEIDAFLRALETRCPPLAQIDTIETHPIDMKHFTGFEILESGNAGAETRVTPDAATCVDCVDEITTDGRRRGYAFTNCTNCGPRFTILKNLPYDRAKTSMAHFEMCPACAAEYADPSDRRFHAQPIACPNCGPKLAMSPASDDPLRDAVRRLRAGEIVAIKGLGGFHIACDATNADAVAKLRERKRRPTKPFALMGSLSCIRRYASVSPDETARLQDPAAPIVLLHSEGTALPESIAPGFHELGWMLPYTPLHHLLLRDVGRPLVMTSGNLSGEPQVIGNEEAAQKLGDIADAILLHDRDIVRRLDDSVERETAHGPMILRRARGRVPGTLQLPPGFEDAPDVVAYGAHLKSAICLTKNGQALLSHHLGDLDDPLTWDEFVKADADYAALFDHAPEAVACDLHPDYRSSRHASDTGLPCIEVQHHHAHLASCLAENMWPRDGGRVAGIILDGLGLCDDGTVWGGEVLIGDYQEFERYAWLDQAHLPGGDAANREPWRNLLARLLKADLDPAAHDVLADKPIGLLQQAMDAGVNAPLSSSAGRLFDAMAAALGFDGAQSFEGEAAMQLEAWARKAPAQEAGGSYGLRVPLEGGAIIDTDLWAEVMHDRDAGVSIEAMAMRFHTGVAQSFAAVARHVVKTGRAQAVALSGGCFQNALLLDLMIEALGDVPVLLQTKVPANDGGLALGQALVAMARLEAK
ncbi:carbamoyltransferase HypF [Marivita hallyeonensis]|nr:carbamoyltransferase HypF [Marivita hallyeonensis]